MTPVLLIGLVNMCFSEVFSLEYILLFLDCVLVPVDEIQRILSLAGVRHRFRCKCWSKGEPPGETSSRVGETR